MNYTIFYSWQSDLPSSSNRSFIQSALEKATRLISKDETFQLDAVVDRDTYGIAGSLSIVESITGKIAKSDVFVCDISIINSSESGRPTPNPNVLYELGFASAILGWQRIIMIQNTAYGNIEMLPFDLRGRRILQYCLHSSIENKSEEKTSLKDNLTQILKAALKPYSNEYFKKEKILWWGKWNIESKIKMHGGQLHIFKVSSDAFFFKITIFEGARAGEIWGKVEILTPHSAYAKIRSEENKKCEIIFRRRLENNEWIIEVEEGTNCDNFHGLSATFSGQYKHDTELVINDGFLDELDFNEIERMTGKYLSTFLNNFQQFAKGENLDNDENVYVVFAGVKGLYSIMESMVVLDNKGNIWCAFIDPNSDVVRYFSNTRRKSKTVDEWLSQFHDKQLIENDNNNQYITDI